GRNRAIEIADTGVNDLIDLLGWEGAHVRRDEHLQVIVRKVAETDNLSVWPKAFQPSCAFSHKRINTARLDADVEDADRRKQPRQFTRPVAQIPQTRSFDERLCDDGIDDNALLNRLFDQACEILLVALRRGRGLLEEHIGRMPRLKRRDDLRRTYG